MSALIKHEGEANRAWHIGEIYQGNPGAGDKLHVPNSNDLVFDFENGLYRVAAVDPQTFIPTLVEWDITKFSGSGVDNLPEGISQKNPRSIYRAFVDYTVSPAKLTIDTSSYIYGSEPIQAKIFLGTDTSEEGTVISRVYTSGGAYLTDTVTLASVIPGNSSIKRVPTTSIDVVLEEGETVTVVAYSASGSAVWEESFVVRESAAIKVNETSTVYLSDISLVTDLLSPTDNTLILNHLGVPFNTNIMQCRLHYSDGTTTDIPIGGNKVKLLGIDDFNYTQLGAPSHLQLQYYPDAEEHAINLANGNNPTLVKNYRLQNIQASASFALKLYVVPVYLGLVDGYELKYWLGNEEYTLFADVTEHVTTTLRNSNQWDPANFATTQQLRATFNAGSVYPGVYPNYIHVQDFNITLKVPAIGVNPWIIDYITDGSNTLGFNLEATGNDSSDTVHVRNNKINQADWLDALYYECIPIYDTELLSAPPEPTHFRLVIAAFNEVIEIGDWEEIISIPDGTMVNNSTAKIEWLFQANPGDPYTTLGVTPLLLRVS